MAERFHATKHLARVLGVRPRLDIMIILANGSATIAQIAEKLQRRSAQIQKHLDALAAENLVAKFDDRYSLTERVNLASTPEQHIFDITTTDGGLTLGLKSRID